MDYEELLKLVKGSNETLEQISGHLQKLAEPASVAAAAPVVTQGIGDQAAPQGYLERRLMDVRLKHELRSVLRTKSTAEIHMLFSMALSKGVSERAGVPFEMWASQGGQANSIFDGFRQGAGSRMASDVDPTVLRALDTGGAAALIRTDLEPFLYELYIREFPGYDRMSKEPANGLIHSYNQITGFGAARFMPELGTVTDDTSVYARKSTNIAIAATRRGLSLKSQYAVAAGGMSYNPMDLELKGGLRAISKLMQDQIFSGQSSDSGGTSSTETGAYDANGFDGLRTILNTARAKNVDPIAGTPEDIKFALDGVIAEITQAGGSNPSITWWNPLDKIKFDQQWEAKTRIVQNYVDIAVGVRAAEVNFLSGAVPLGIVPGNSISEYNTANADGSFNGGELVRDVYVLDESTVGMPYLGSEGPTVLDIPIGISGQLTHLFIIFLMNGFMVKALPFSNKLRVKHLTGA
jgi:hypothetical protein